jgi:hypothetical protein
MASAAASARLEKLAQDDPELAPYARLLDAALAAAAEDWPLELPDAEQRLRAGEPAFHGATLPWKGVNTEGLDATQLKAALELRDANTHAQLTLLPLLHAARRACERALKEVTWTSGICPVCAAWPALAESRGLERQRMLRCGRCGSEWSLPWQLCPFCANDHHASLSYLYSEQLGEARRVFTCNRCHGYLKTLATLAAIDPLAVPVEDLDTLQLDLAALDAGFHRPTEPGFELHLELTST